MARQKKDEKKVADIVMPQEKKEFICVCCGKSQNKEKGFYKSYSLILQGNDNRMVVCKQCVVDLYEVLVKKYENCKIALYFLCRLLDVYFDASLYPSVELQALNSGSNIAQIYFQKCNSLPQYSKKTFFDSTPLDFQNEKNVFEISQPEMSIEDKKNKDDVIRMVGYDPFNNENPMDKKSLYNMLVDFLDESTLEDSFKLPIVIEIVKSFNQIDKINQALALITADINSISGQSGGVKALFDTKQKIYASILSMAKDNGISVNHNNQKSKGGGTLSGIIKKLQELGFSESDVNIFNIETAQGIKQVADISNQSILNQLMFDENDYTEMIKEQRILLEDYRNKYQKFEEENRLLKIELENRKNGDI